MARGRLVDRCFGAMVAMAVGIASFGTSLQTFAEGEIEITKITPEKLEENGRYTIRTEAGFLHFRDLVNNGQVPSTATISLTKNLDLTERGTYRHGYCDKPARNRSGAVVGWYTAEIEVDESDDGDDVVYWALEEPYTIGAIEITEETLELEVGNVYVIENAQGYSRFKELDNLYKGYRAGVSVILLGSINADGEYVKQELDEDGQPVGWCEARTKHDGAFGDDTDWEMMGDGCGRYIPVGTKENGFIAKFYGQSHAITLTANVEDGSGDAYAGVFGYVGEGGEISNLELAMGSYIKASGNFGNAGGIAGCIEDAKIIRCCNAGDICCKECAGGMVGSTLGGAVTECGNTGNVSSARGVAGGMVGRGVRCEITQNCCNSGVIRGGHAGGMAGCAFFGTKIDKCHNAGSVSTIDTCEIYISHVGGIAGSICDFGAVTQSSNSGTISGEGRVGGIVGDIKRGSTVSGCRNNGVVDGSSAGGIVGRVKKGTVRGCYNTGDVKGRFCVGGVAGGIYNGATITGSRNEGAVSGGEVVGGVVGYVSESVVKESWSAGDGITESCAGKVGRVAGCVVGGVVEEAECCLEATPAKGEVGETESLYPGAVAKDKDILDGEEAAGGNEGEEVAEEGLPCMQPQTPQNTGGKKVRFGGVLRVVAGK